MHPFLIDFGLVDLPLIGLVRVALPSYGVLMATAVVLAWSWFVRNATKDGIDREVASSVVFWSVIGGLIGGKLGLVLVEWRRFWEAPQLLLGADFITAAGVIWTGVLGGTLTMIWVSRRAGLPVATVLDAAAPALPLAQLIGRFGCLLAGCCYGAPTTLPWGIAYHNAEGHARTGVPLDLPLHPAPIYESLYCALVVLPVVLWVRARRKQQGEAILAYLIVYGLGRSVIETTRGDLVRGVDSLGLSTSQWISAVMVITAAALWWWRRRSKLSEPIVTPSA